MLRRTLLRLSRCTERLLLTVFWLLLLLAFNAPPLAMLTVLCAVMHELGHIGAAVFLDHRLGSPLRRANGFLLPVRTALSYKEEIFVAAMGPAVNILFVLLCLFARPLGAAFFDAFASLSFFTAAANLLPVSGYDGERILRAWLSLHTDSQRVASVCSALSIGLSGCLTLLALYGILRTGGAYWIFGVFFFTLIFEMRSSLLSCMESRRHFSRKTEKNREN